LEYLGHIISGAGIEPEPSKFATMTQWPPPFSSKDLRAFLGLTGFYRRFIRNYASIASPLTTLLCRDNFAWSPPAQSAFDHLKKAMTSALVLTPPDFSIPFVLKTDASGIAMGAVLMQNNKPIAYFSKQFTPKLQRASTYTRELHAIMAAVDKWRQYLLGHKFVILTDHRSLQDLMTQVIQTPEQHYYLAKLLGYDYQIKFKRGHSNVVADALSRVPQASEGLCLILHIPQFDFMQQLLQSLQTNTEFQEKLRSIQVAPTAFPTFLVHNDLIYYKGSIWIPDDNPFIPALLHEFHSTPLGGHFGVLKTIHRLQANFTWPNIHRDVRNYIKNCQTCQQTKPILGRPAVLLQPLPIPSGIWEDISMDFITHLPSSHNHTIIMVVVDRFSKGVHFGALHSNFTAYKVALLFLDIICKLHGFPRSIVSDWDPIFVSQFWRELFRLSGTTLRLSTAYHPQSDGQIEVINKVLEQYLRAFIHDRPTEWFKHLPLAEWSYNTSLHSSTGVTPFEIIYGKPPPSIPNSLLPSSSNEAAESLLRDRTLAHQKLQNCLLKAQLNMKRFADMKRRPKSFEVGQWVHVKLRPHRQTSISGSSQSKLTKRFFGPFEITERIGPVAYHLKLPNSSKIHPVFHCSLLRCYYGPLPPIAHNLPPTTQGNQPILEPLAILAQKDDTTTSSPTSLVLVQWKGLPPEETSWEPLLAISDKLHLEDKVSLPAGGIVSNTDNTNHTNNTPAQEENDNISNRPIKNRSRPVYLTDYE